MFARRFLERLAFQRSSGAVRLRNVKVLSSTKSVSLEMDERNGAEEIAAAPPEETEGGQKQSMTSESGKTYFFYH